jgi:hypothetical protein
MKAAIYTRISSGVGTALGVARQEEDRRTLSGLPEILHVTLGQPG